MLKILWKRGEIAPEEQFLLLSTIFCYLVLDFYVKARVRFSLRYKRCFEITEVEITRVDCTISTHRSSRFISNMTSDSRGLAIAIAKACFLAYGYTFVFWVFFFWGGGASGVLQKRTTFMIACLFHWRTYFSKVRSILRVKKFLLLEITYIQKKKEMKLTELLPL